jgi:hypothetical protein
MAFVVPAELGHAPYAKPLLQYLKARFSSVHVVAVRKKLFSDLSEDAWLLFADEFGGQTQSICFSALDRFDSDQLPPTGSTIIDAQDWEEWNGRLRPFLLNAKARGTYRRLLNGESHRLKELAQAGIGYVTGANDFFHLRPSEARRWRIPSRFLVPAIRNSRFLANDDIDDATVRRWLDADEPVLLLRIKPDDSLPSSVREYLDSPAGFVARQGYKCRNRSPWYAVPDVRVPDAFLSYMTGDVPALVRNSAGCVACNTVHAVFLREGVQFEELSGGWSHPMSRLSFELEGHPLGGGMLKLEPREAAQIVIPAPKLKISEVEKRHLEAAYHKLRKWRHYA